MHEVISESEDSRWSTRSTVFFSCTLCSRDTRWRCPCITGTVPFLRIFLSVNHAKDATPSECQNSSDSRGAIVSCHTSHVSHVSPSPHRTSYSVLLDMSGLSCQQNSGSNQSAWWRTCWILDFCESQKFRTPIQYWILDSGNVLIIFKQHSSYTYRTSKSNKQIHDY
jgi:hypothetical protein